MTTEKEEQCKRCICGKCFPVFESTICKMIGIVLSQDAKLSRYKKALRDLVEDTYCLDPTFKTYADVLGNVDEETVECGECSWCTAKEALSDSDGERENRK